MALRKFRKLEEGSSKFSNIRKIRKKQMNDAKVGKTAQNMARLNAYILAWIRCNLKWSKDSENFAFTPNSESYLAR